MVVQLTAPVSGAPNALDLSATVSITHSDDPELGTIVVVEFGDAIPADVTMAKLIMRFGSDRATYPFAIATGTASYDLGNLATISPRLQGDFDGYRLAFKDAEGWGWPGAEAAPVVDGVSPTPEGTAPTVGAITISGTGIVSTSHSLTGGAVTGDPTPAVSYQWLLDGVEIGTSATVTPSSTGTLVGKKTATNDLGSVTVESPPITISSANVAPSITALEITGSGIVGDAHTCEVTATGTPAPTLTYQWQSGGTNISGATSATYTPVATHAALTCEVTATNSEGSDSDETAARVVTSGAPAALTAGDWSISSVTVVNATTRHMDKIQISAAKGAIAAKWGTPSQTFLENPANVFPAGYSDMTLDGTADGMQTWDTGTSIGGDGWDYTNFDPTNRSGDVDRQARAQVVIQTVSGGPWSPASDLKVVPDVPATIGHFHAPIYGRTPEQFAAGLLGGRQRQFFRARAKGKSNPDLLIMGQDMSAYLRTESFGDLWVSHTPTGLLNAECGIGIGIDFEDATRRLYYVSAADRRGRGGPNEWDAVSGIWLDDGATVTLKLQLDKVPSTGESGGRDVITWLVQHEDASKTPQTRVWYAIHKPREYRGTYEDGKLYKSTDGGSTWAEAGEALTNSKFGDKIFCLRCAPNGDLYIGCDNGLFRMASGGSSFTECTGIPAGLKCLEIDCSAGSGEVWAAIGHTTASYSITGQGLYKSTNGTAFSQNSSLGNYRIVTVGRSEGGKLLVAGHNGVTPKWNHSGNGTGAWSNISNSVPEGYAGFTGLLHNNTAWMEFMHGSETEVIAHRAQHMGKSNDGGKTFAWGANGADTVTSKGIAAHPTDYLKGLHAVQDEVLWASTDGYDSFFEHNLNSETREEIKVASGNAGSGKVSGGGCLILVNGAQEAWITGAGGADNDRVPLYHTAVGGNPIGATEITTPPVVGGCGHAANDATDASYGWMGRWKFAVGSGGAITRTDIGQEFFAAGPHNVIYGGAKGGASNRDIYRSTNGTSFPAAAWATTPENYRALAGYPQRITASRQDSALVYVGTTGTGSAGGKVYRIAGASSPTTTLIFNMRDYISVGVPAYEICVVACDPRDDNILYAGIAAYGVPNLFRTVNAKAATPAWENITYNRPLMPMWMGIVHPLTGDLILGTQHGSTVCPPPEGYKATHGISVSLYERSAAFCAANYGTSGAWI